jgi:hypothetical protein
MSADVSLATGGIFGLTPGDTVELDASIDRINDAGLGSITLDTGWYMVPYDTTPDAEDCIGGRSYRVLWWHDVRLAFWQQDQRAVLWSWSVGDREVSWFGKSEPVPPPSVSPSGLATVEGVTVGAPSAAIDRTVFASERPQHNDLEVYTSVVPSSFNGPIVVGERNGAIAGYGAQLGFC